MPSRPPLIAAWLIAGLLAACGRAPPAGPVRTPEQARQIAEQTLKSAGLDEEVLGVARQGGGWIVTTRWRETSVAGHLVTVDAATGKVTVERYRSLELAPPPR
ncbi:MAG: hypothetical protein JWQ97_1019 [Phenylobacterium sp.]|nr:hypothetical protein [Phenylobacterium sp.]